MGTHTVEICGKFKYVVDVEANSGEEAEEIAISELMDDAELDLEIIDVGRY